MTAKEDPISQLIDIALDVRDFKWVEELSKCRKQESQTAYTAEDIYRPVGILENGSIRNIVKVNDQEILFSEVAMLPEITTKRGTMVKYRLLNTYEKYYVYGYLKATSFDSYSMF